MKRSLTSLILCVVFAGCVARSSPESGDPPVHRCLSCGGGFPAPGSGPDPSSDPNGSGADSGVQHPNFPLGVRASSPPPPISGGTLLVLRDGSGIIAADADRDTVTRVDLPARSLAWTAKLEAGDEPGRLAEDGAGRLHVVLRHAGAVATVDLASGRIIERSSVCAQPRGIAYDPAIDRLYTACAEGLLLSLAASGGPPLSVALLEPDLRDVVVNPAGIWVSTFRSGAVLRVGADGAVLARSAIGLGFGDDSNEADVAWRMTSIGGSELAVIHQTAETQGVNPDPGGYAGGMSDPCHTAIVNAAITFVGPAGGWTMPVPTAVLPVDVAQGPLGELVIAAAGNTYRPDLSGLVETRAAPTSLGFDDDGGPSAADGGGVLDAGSPPDAGFTGFCSGSSVQDDSPLGPGAGAIIAVAFAPDGTLYAQRREPAELTVFTTFGGVMMPASHIALSSDHRGDTGHDVFHTAAGSPIACASCHPEGGDDGRVWTFVGLGPRRTPSLLGTIQGTAPYHWDGSLAGMGPLLSEVYQGRMSGPPLDPDTRDALSSWVFGLPAPAAPAASDPAGVARGNALFHGKAACAACHNGPHFTNNATLDVGTGGSFQVPPLVGLRWRAPYMHDGCALTLADRFGPCATPGHGATGTLSSTETADLISYLETL
jgi:hypothetical protein